MEISDDGIRRAAKGKMRPVGPCLAGEELDAYFSGRVPEGRADEIRAHLAACSGCLEMARDFQLFLKAESPRPRVVERKSLYRNPMLQIAVAASLVFGIWFFSRAPSVTPPPDTSDVRGPGREGVLELLSPKGDLAERPRRFEWKGVAQATAYEVELRGVDLKVLWTAAGVRGTSQPLPGEVADALRSGQDYGWRVTAILPNGRRVASGIQTFRFR